MADRLYITLYPIDYISHYSRPAMEVLLPSRHAMTSLSARRLILSAARINISQTTRFLLSRSQCGTRQLHSGAQPPVLLGHCDGHHAAPDRNETKGRSATSR